MLSLSILYGGDEILPELVRYISKNPEGDDDPLWSVLLARLGYLASLEVRILYSRGVPPAI